MELPSFLSQQPPPGYIPGIGRGATGFSTRGDKKGPAKVPKRLQNQDTVKAVDGDSKEQDEDSEADKVFSDLDSKLSSRNRSKKREGDQQSIPHQFADLKRSLATVSEDQWLNIPDAGDYTRKRRRERLDEQLNRKTYAAPDTLLMPHVNLSKLTEEREKMLSRQLDSNIFEKEDSNSVNEAQKYLNDLETFEAGPRGDEEDVKKMRTILQSYRNADPKKPEGWVAAARLEEKARKLKTARNIIEQGCLECPRNEDVWLENIRLNSADTQRCKTLAAQGIKFNPQSLQLWIKAVDLEREVLNKHRVVRSSLQELPLSEELWKLAVKYSADKFEAQRILQKAVELIPTSIELCSALVHLQNYQEAKHTLNAARKAMPRELKVWILAAEVEESKGEAVTDERILKLLSKGIKQLKENGLEITLLQLLKEAQSLVKEGGLRTAHALTQAALSEFQDEYEASRVVSELSDSIVKVVGFKILLKSNPTKYSFWQSLKKLCEKLNKMDELYNTFETLLFDESENFRILKQNPLLSLMYSKEIWKNGHDIPKSLEILDRAQNILPNSLEVWLAKLKFLCLTDQVELAQKSFAMAMERLRDSQVPHLEKLYYKYISFLRFRRQNTAAIKMLNETCIPKFPNCPKFYLQLGQIHYDLGQTEESQMAFERGTKMLPQGIPLWISLARIEEIDLKRPAKARSIFDLALLKNPANETLSLARAQMEARLGNYDQARFIIQQSLQKHSKSATLWAENIRILPLKRANVKKTVFQDALKNTNNSCEILVEIGISFYKELQHETAIKWFERATRSNPSYGDSWVWVARCYKKLNRNIQEIVNQVEIHEPTHGNLWISVSKKPDTQYYSCSKILLTLLESENVV
ncbi:hypothetical protein ZYGR_0A01340 [Zygosaccharomyces rouxii]|uniref:ZYRO0A03036p n=2 Tax=Zygosaccharomyces rouxii TaxID=4956 RepID=C5DPF8_ZYGRC|nr:uncharacterized protein ZYRO0A03036g [Zygosaccharomyces rouxii]KAH9198910.1 PRP1 splicing factor, N-terminal-domain-containing protein [Zygosaccharomyces rouxii]GAV46542.1 hypothetical protein ZYGR_0A01340 [Zygosaccharomyces rouxii]CAR25569.1 ZYRO0A03036p [Zygosaccharomyces rouxii]